MCHMTFILDCLWWFGYHKNCLDCFPNFLTTQKTTQMEEFHNMEYIFDKSQSEAIRHFKGACLCIAAPGSG